VVTYTHSWESGCDGHAILTRYKEKPVVAKLNVNNYTSWRRSPLERMVWNSTKYSLNLKLEWGQHKLKVVNHHEIDCCKNRADPAFGSCEVMLFADVNSTYLCTPAALIRSMNSHLGSQYLKAGNSLSRFRTWCCLFFIDTVRSWRRGGNEDFALWSTSSLSSRS
jgi:hypothetical protein